MRREDVLAKALAAVMDRPTAYGDPEDNFARIALLWNAYLAARREPARPLNSADVALMLDLFKTARLANDQTHTDSWIDKAGYSACGGECAARTD